MTDLVVVSLEAWDAVWRRNQHLIWRLLQSDPDLRVLFVEPPADPLHAIRSGRRPQFGKRPADGALPGRLWTMRAVKVLPRRLDPHADRRMADRIVRAAATLGMRDPILWVNDPGGAEVARRTGWRTLYDMTDDWLAAARPAAELARVGEQERDLLTSAQEVIACSAELQRRKSPARPPDRHPIVLIRNAVDTAAYRAPHPRPADLPDGRIALYVGTLHADRLDVALCEALSLRLSGRGRVVLVGPDALTGAERDRLRTAGVQLLGSRTADEVIGYLQAADVLLVPHVVTAFTDSLDPIKLYEYQAVGRPVISTPVAGFRDADDVRITIASGDHFADAVLHAIESGPVSPPRAAAAVADWDDRAQQVVAVLERMAR